MTQKVSSDGEIRVIFAKITSNAVSELKSFFSSCLIEDSIEITEIRDELNNFKIFLGISSKKDANGRDKWKACCLLAQEENFRVRSSSRETVHQHIDGAFADFRNVMQEFHENYDDDGVYAIIDALKAAEAFSSQTLDEMSESLIEVGLNEKFRTKFSARKFVEILKNFLDGGNEIKVNEIQLENLIHILTSENFAADEAKVQLETLKVLKILKSKSFAEFSKKNLEKVQKFLDENRSAYKDVISLCQKSRNKSYRAMLGQFLQGRVDFLTSLAIFGAKIQNEDLFEVLALKNSKNSLKEKKENLTKISKEIEEVRSDPDSKPSAMIRLASEFNELQAEINFYKVIERAKSEVNIGEFLSEFEKIYQEDSKGVLGYLKEKATKTVEGIQEFIKGEGGESQGLDTNEVKVEEALEAKAEKVQEASNNEVQFEQTLDDNIEVHESSTTKEVSSKIKYNLLGRPYAGIFIGQSIFLRIFEAPCQDILFFL